LRRGQNRDNYDSKAMQVKRKTTYESQVSILQQNSPLLSEKKISPKKEQYES
jgi:hypothetical protein